MTGEPLSHEAPELEQLWLDCRIARDRWQDALRGPAGIDRIVGAASRPSPSFTIEEILGHSDARVEELLTSYQRADALYRLARHDHYRGSRTHDPLAGAPGEPSEAR